MASNPRKALAALLPSPIDVGAGCSVRPVTLGMFALLESIDSPLLEARPGVKTLELVPSLYILTHPAEESLTGGLLERAAAWADTVPVSILARIREAASRQVAAVLNVVPETQTVKKRHKRIPRILDRVGGKGLRLDLPANNVGNSRQRPCRNVAAMAPRTRR